MAANSHIDHSPEAVASGEFLYGALIDALPLRAFIKDRNSVYLACNALLALDYGLPKYQIIGRRDDAFFPPALARRYQEDDRRLMENGSTETFEEPYQRDGQERWIRTTKQPLRGKDGSILGIIGFFEDITDQVGISRSLAISESNLKEAQRLNQIGSWELNLRSGELFWSDEIFRIFEIDPQLFGASYEAFLNAVHPDDRDLVNRSYSDSVRDRTTYSISHRLQMADGRIKFVQERGETIYDESGTPIRSVGTVQDITVQKEAESQLALMAKVFEHNQQAVIITDADNRIVRVNRAFTLLTGYAAHEVEGRDPKLLASDKTPPETHREMWDSLSRTDY